MRLAARGAWANRGRSVLTVLAVVLSVGFMSAVLMLSGGLSSQADSGVAAAYAKVSLVVHGEKILSNPPGEFIPQSGAPVSAAALSAVKAAPGVTEAEGLRSGYAVLEKSDGKVVGNPGTGGGVGQSWLGSSPLNPYRLVSGQGPTSDGQVALDQAAATSAGVSVGQKLTLVTSTGRHQVTVVGIVDYGSATGPFDTTAVLLPAEQAQSLLGISDVYDQILVSAPQSAMSAVATAVSPWNAQVQSGTSWVAAENSAIDTTLSFERDFLYGFALVALAAGGTLISNTFTVTIAQRTRELALARALGATTRQVLTAVLAEAAAVGMVASLVGAAAGVGVAALIRAVFSLLHLTLFDTHAVVSISSLALPAVIGVAVTLLAALLPALRASRAAPIAALREQQVDESGHSRGRAVTGVVLLILGAVGMAAGVSGKSAGLAIVGLAGLMFGVVIAGPLLIAAPGPGRGRADAPPGGPARAVVRPGAGAQPAPFGRHRRRADDRRDARVVHGHGGGVDERGHRKFRGHGQPGPIRRLHRLALAVAGQRRHDQPGELGSGRDLGCCALRGAGAGQGLDDHGRYGRSHAVRQRMELWLDLRIPRLADR